MAQLKDTVVSGSLRATDSLLTTTLQTKIIKVPATAGGSDYSTGTNKYVLLSNGSSAYWGTATVITEVGTISAGKWQGTTVATGYGGTGVTSHTANRLVWSTSATTLQAGYHYANTTKVAINSTSEPSYNFYVNGTSFFNSAVRIQYSTPNLYIRNTNGDKNTYSILRFGNDNRDDGAILFLNDSARTDDGGANMFTIRNNAGEIRINDDTVNTGYFTVGQATRDTSYKFYVNGTSYFNGNTTHNGVDYFANGTTYYINNSADAVLRRGLFAGTDTASANSYFNNGAIEIREVGRVGTGQTAFRYAPRIGFHWSGRIAATFNFHKDGLFYLRKQDGITRADLDANIRGYLEGATFYDDRDQTAERWYNFAKIIMTGNYQDAWIKFDVSSGEDARRCGVLVARFRTNATWTDAANATPELYWETIGENVNVEDFRFSLDNSGNGQLWCRCPGRWTGWHFIVINRGTSRANARQQQAEEETARSLYWHLQPSASNNGPSSYQALNRSITSVPNYTVRDVGSYNQKTTFNYAGAGLAGSAISWFACWNGYQLRAISKAETFNAVRDNGGDSRWVTLTTEQTISGVKHFTGNLWWGTSNQGGYLNGAATNGGINSIRVGDDVWLGDCNAGGIMGMKSTGANCGFYMYNSSGTQIGQLYFNGTNLYCNKTIEHPDASVSYIAGSKGSGAALYAKKTYDADHWYPAVALETKGGGAWQIGNYNDETLEFQYATKANRDSNTNSTSEIYMQNGDTGRVITTGNKGNWTFTPSSHTHDISQVTWAAGSNLVCNGANTEWSIDMASNATGSYWHVWSGVKGASCLICYNDDRRVNIPVRLDTPWLRVVNDSSNTGDDCALYVQCQTSNDWGIRVYKGAYNYGLKVDALDQGDAIWTNGYIRARCVWANQGSNGERQCGVDSSTSGTLYLWSNTTNKGLYSGSGYSTGTVILVNSSGKYFYGNSSTTSSLADSAHAWGATEVYNWMTARLEKSGGTMTGALNFANNTWNNVGDDCAMGDCNQSGLIGIKSLNNANRSGFQFYNSSGTALAVLAATGANLINVYNNLYAAGYIHAAGNLHTDANVDMIYNNTWWDVLRNYNNGNTGINAAGGGVYLGYNNTTGIYFYTNGGQRGYVNNNGVYGAVWNDFAEFRKSEFKEPGRVVIDDGYGCMHLCNERLTSGARIISDTYGMSVGYSTTQDTPIGIGGRVLAYPYQNRNNYKVGDAVCSAPNGTVDIMTREEIKEYPERIIGIVSEVPTYDVWKQQAEKDSEPVSVKVKGRIWIYVR